MIYDHDFVFLQGDLNYRIDGRRDQVIQNAEAGNFAPLLEQDQLKKQFKTAPGFRLQSYKEAPIKFAPTYKYDKWVGALAFKLLLNFPQKLSTIRQQRQRSYPSMVRSRSMAVGGARHGGKPSLSAIRMFGV
jgi:hypothetical protein